MKADDVRRAHKKVTRKMAWLALRARPWRERFMSYPFRTVWCALVDRFWFTYIALTGNPLVGAKTFWGQSITVRFVENRSIVHDGLIDSKELAVTAFLVHHLTSQDIFFDVGANAGFYSLLASALGAHVTAFEPMPETYEILKKNVPQAALVNKALMDKSGSLLFADYGAGAGLNKALLNEKAERAVTVQATTLDTFCTEHAVFPTIIKIDAENAEPQVITGGRTILQKYHPTIIVEGNELIIHTLQSLGYDAFQLRDTGEAVPYKTGDTIFNDNLLFKKKS